MLKGDDNGIDILLAVGVRDAVVKEVTRAQPDLALHDFPLDEHTVRISATTEFKGTSDNEHVASMYAMQSWRRTTLTGSFHVDQVEEGIAFPCNRCAPRARR